MMSEIALCIQSCLQDEWHMTHAIGVGEEWQVNISDSEHVCVATGETIEEALLNAQAKADEGKYVGILFRLAPHRSPEAKAIEGRSLLAQLGLTKPTLPLRRRI